MFFGVICFLQLGVSQLPEATPPQLTIEAYWQGAAPEVMETQIVNPIEQAAISVQGLENINANIHEGVCHIHLTFYTGKSIDAAMQETNSKLRSVALPSDVLPPTIEKENTDDHPIMWLAVTSSKRSFKDIVTFVDLHDGRTEVVTHQTNVPAAYLGAEARAGFATSLDRFDAYLAGLPE